MPAWHHEIPSKPHTRKCQQNSKNRRDTYQHAPILLIKIAIIILLYRKLRLGVRTRIPRSGYRLKLPVPIQGYYHNQHEGETKDEHAPVYEAIKGGRVIFHAAPAAPIIKTAASQGAHQRGPEYTSIAHTGGNTCD
jgi:hypothetical protein